MVSGYQRGVALPPDFTLLQVIPELETGGAEHCVHGCVQHCVGLTALVPVFISAATPLPSTLAPDVDRTRPASLSARTPERPPRPVA